MSKHTPTKATHAVGYVATTHISHGYVENDGAKQWTTTVTYNSGDLIDSKFFTEDDLKSLLDSGGIKTAADWKAAQKAAERLVP